MYLYFMVLDSCLRTGEVTESALLASGEISILHIILEMYCLKPVKSLMYMKCL